MANQHLLQYNVERDSEGSVSNKEELFEQVLINLRSERSYQEARWGQQFDDRNTANDWAAYIGRYVADATHFDTTPDRFQEAMLKVATLALTAVETSLRNGGPADRHYDP